MINLGCPYNFTFPNISKALLLVPKDKDEIMQRVGTQSTDFRIENKLVNKFQNIYIYFQQTFETLLRLLINIK